MGPREIRTWNINSAGVWPDFWKKARFSPFRPQREFRHVWGVKIGVFGHGESIFEVFRPTRGPLGPQNSKNTQKRAIFFSYLALARQDPGWFRVFIAYSCSHREYRSNGVSHSPNPGLEPPPNGPQSWVGVNFGPKRPQKSIIGPKMALFFRVDPWDFTVPLGYRMPHVHLKFEPNPPKNAREMAKKPFFLWFFFSYLALARQDPGWFRVFITYSCSHRAYGSNGVWHPPNLAGEPPLKWPQSWSGRDFGVKMTPKGLKKLQTGGD